MVEKRPTYSKLKSAQSLQHENQAYKNKESVQAVHPSVDRVQVKGRNFVGVHMPHPSIRTSSSERRIATTGRIVIRCMVSCSESNISGDALESEDFVYLSWRKSNVDRPYLGRQ